MARSLQSLFGDMSTEQHREQEPSCLWELEICTERNRASRAVGREERAAKPGNPSQQRLRQDDSCLPIHSLLKSKGNQPRLLPAPRRDAELWVSVCPSVPAQPCLM